MSSRKKILHVRHSIGEGGITTFVHALIDLNKSTDTSHHILVWKDLPALDYNYDFIDITKSSNKQKDFANIIQDYDSVFVHSLMPFMLWSLFKRRSSVYLFQHGITYGSGKKKLFKQLYYFFVINLFRFKIICSSKFAKRKLLSKVKVFNKKLIHIIGFGINIDVNKSQVKSKDDILKIGFAGRLVEQKKVTRIIDALAFVKDEVNVEFHIAGDGPLAEDLKNRSKEFIGTKINFVFYGFQKDMNDFYSKLDVFILPSVGESFGLVVLEAFSRNIPTIVFSDTGACVEFIENGSNGYIVDNEQELSLKIKALSDGALRNELKSKMNAMGLKNYDISTTRAKLDVL